MDHRELHTENYHELSGNCLNE